jgi:hypothetical protein
VLDRRAGEEVDDQEEAQAALGHGGEAAMQVGAPMRATRATFHAPVDGLQRDLIQESHVWSEAGHSAVCAVGTVVEVSSSSTAPLSRCLSVTSLIFGKCKNNKILKLFVFMLCKSPKT